MPMSSDTQELVDICEQLPDLERAEVADFARFLLAKRKNITDEDQVWERTIADGRRRPKLDELFVRRWLRAAEPYAHPIGV